MVRYSFECVECGFEKDVYKPMSQAPMGIPCDDCEKPMHRVWGVNVAPFKEYVEQNMPGGPYLISSKEQRDFLCEKHGVTYETVSDLRPKNTSACDEVTYDEVMTEVHKENDLGSVSSE